MFHNIITILTTFCVQYLLIYVLCFPTDTLHAVAPFGVPCGSPGGHCVFHHILVIIVTYKSTFFVFSQTLFMQLPRLVFLAAALAVIACFMSCFTVYHAYLVVTNQTTNERYKRYYLRKAHNTHLQCHPFSRGVVNNILEEVLPLWSISNKARVENARENSKNGPRAERKKKR